jgi:hypothetical protein
MPANSHRLFIHFRDIHVQVLSLFLLAGTLTFIGCETSSTPQTVTTNEDGINAYEATIEADQEATETDAETEDSQ